MTLQSFGVDADSDIASLAPWFHNLHLPDGRRTAPDHPLGDFPAFKWKQIEKYLPADMEGMTALDIGCNAGFYSFAMAQRGATVLGIDHDEHYLAQANWARSKFRVEGNVEFEKLDVYDLARLSEGFDLILFMGVMYHLRYPLLALDIVSEHCRGRMILQTLSLPSEHIVEPPDDLALEDRELLLEPGWPTLAFVERSMAGDPSNWWLANDACVEAMVRSSGLRIWAKAGHEMWVCERENAFSHQYELDAATGRRAQGTGLSPNL